MRSNHERDRRRGGAPPLLQAAPRPTLVPSAARSRTLELEAAELALLAEALRDHLRSLELWLRRLERDRAHRPDAPAPTPLSGLVRTRCQEVRAMIRRVEVRP